MALRKARHVQYDAAIARSSLTHYQPAVRQRRRKRVVESDESDHDDDNYNKSIMCFTLCA